MKAQERRLKDKKHLSCVSYLCFPNILTFIASFEQHEVIVKEQPIQIIINKTRECSEASSCMHIVSTNGLWCGHLANRGHSYLSCHIPLSLISPSPALISDVGPSLWPWPASLALACLGTPAGQACTHRQDPSPLQEGRSALDPPLLHTHL